jgi:thiol-disulfide isomerase/thioredoxin
MKGLRLTVLVLAACAAFGSAGAATSTPHEFTHSRASDWINSPPLTLAGLKGKVVLVEFWAFECVNCLNSAAWVETMVHSKSDAGLVVIGVHTPELATEKSADNVRNAVKRLGIGYPVMLDTDYSYWNAVGNHYWPTFYIIGRDGLLYGAVPGEMHVGDERSGKVEEVINRLLAAPAP